MDAVGLIKPKDKNPLAHDNICSWIKYSTTCEIFNFHTASQNYSKCIFDMLVLFALTYFLYKKHFLVVLGFSQPEFTRNLEIIFFKVKPATALL